MIGKFREYRRKLPSTPFELSTSRCITGNAPRARTADIRGIRESEGMRWTEAEDRKHEETA